MNFFTQLCLILVIVYLAGVLEYLTAELLELSGETSIQNKKKRIIPRHIMLAIENDAELKELLKDVTIAEGGVPPNIHPVLLPTNSKKKERDEEDEPQSQEV